jgi:hypothetical protein
MNALNTNFWDEDEEYDRSLPEVIEMQAQPQEDFWGEDSIVAQGTEDVWGQDTPVFSQPEATPLPKGPYGQSDLLEPSRLQVVDTFLSDYYGVSRIDNKSPQERVDMFLNHWRYLEAGNTVKTVGFVDYVLSADDFQKRSVAEAYKLFDGLDTSLRTRSETLGAIGDYAWGAIVDPVNVLSPIVGKLFSQVGTKASSKLAIDAATKAMNRAAAQGASPLVQGQIKNRIYGETLRRATKKYGKSEAVKEVMGAAAFDTAVAVGTDIAYQHGLIQTGAQEEVDRLRTGLAALGGIVGGAVSLGVVTMRGASGLPMAGTDIAEKSVANQTDLNGVFARFEANLAAMTENDFIETFGDKVARGAELESLDTTFWARLVLGDTKTGWDGLQKTLYDQGFRWLGPRAEGDKFTNWLADAMNNAPSKEVQAFVDTFQKKTGIVLKEMDGKTPIAQIADNMAKKMSDSGRALNAVSQAAKYMKGKKLEDVTFDDYIFHVFGDAVEDLDPSAMSKKITAFSEKFGDTTRFFQDSYIRMLVSHPGTSALNVIGWSAKTAGQSASDLLRGTLIYGGGGLLKTVSGRGKEAVVDWKKMAGVYKANFNKARNMLDPFTTIESFNSLIERSPEVFKDLTQVLPGGVLRSTATQAGLKTDQPMYQQGIDKFIDGIQTVNLVKAQDVFTKSQELMYNLDIALNDVLGTNFRTLVKREDAAAIMASREYKEAEARALDRTLENILSKSYSRQPNIALKEVASIIEDARKIPLVGVHIPFGRFFNNVVATVSEYSGLTLAFKTVGGNVGQNKTNAELMTKAIVGYAAVASLVPREMNLIQRGFSWDQEVDEATGEVRTEMYDAPFVAVKFAARVAAYHRLGMEVPEEMVSEGFKVIFGQLTRQLSESGELIGDIAIAMARGDGVEAIAGLSEMFEGTLTTATSGATRFVEPANVLIALGSDSENYALLDTQTGNSGTLKAFRYMDQAITALDLQGDALPRVSPTSPMVLRQPGRMFGERLTGPQSNAQRVFAMIGQPSWDAGLFADDRVAKNIVEGTFQPIFDVLAGQLLEDPFFLKADTNRKRALAQEQLKLARELTHQTLRDSPNTKNSRASLIFKLTQNNSVVTLEDKLEEMGLEGLTLDRLTEPQLEVLKHFLDSETEVGLENLYRGRSDR